MEGYAALYFDGETAQRRDVQVHVVANGLTITDQDGATLALWRYPELEALSAFKHMNASRLTCATAPDARLYIEDPDFAQRVLPLAPQLRRRRGDGFAWSQVAMVTGVVVLFVLAVVYGVPKASRPAARRCQVPPCIQVNSATRALRSESLTRLITR